MALRKVNLATTSLTDNVASFVNQTARRLHMRKLVGRATGSAATAAGDISKSSVDEIPDNQDSVNDSRSHIAVLDLATSGGTGAVAPVPQRLVISFNREDLVLDPDEAFFINNVDVVGAQPSLFTWNFWYQD